MARITRTVRAAALALGLLGSAALSGMGPLSAHAGNPPSLQTTAGNCGVYVTGNGFTPSGKVDLYVYGYSGFSYAAQVTATAPRFVPPGRLIGGGTIAQMVYENTSDSMEAIAYDEATKQWSNWSYSTEYCLK